MDRFWDYFFILFYISLFIFVIYKGVQWSQRRAERNRLDEIKKKIRKEKRNYNDNASKIEIKLKDAKISLDRVDRYFHENLYDDFWNSFDESKELLDDSRVHFERMSVCRKNFNDLGKEYLGLLREFHFNTRAKYSQCQGSMTRKKFLDVKARWSKLNDRMEGLFHQGKSHINFASILKNRERIKQNERHHKEKLRQSKIQHEERLIQSELQHDRLMDKNEDILLAQEKTLEFMEEEKKERDERRKDKNK